MKKNEKITKRITTIASMLLCASIVINCVQGYFNIKIVNQKNSEMVSLERYRDLQKRQIEYVENRCYSGYIQYGADGQNDSKFKQMGQIAYFEAPRYVNVDSEAFYKDLIFDYLQSICLKPLILLLGAEDIYGYNLEYFTKWGYFHFDDKDFDKVRW